jgi:TonB family protein
MPPSPRNVDPGRGWLTDRPVQAPEVRKRFGGAVGLSILAHALFFLILVAILAVPGVSDMIVEKAPNIVYVFSPGPGGGGGGGGNQSQEPARQVELEVPKPPKPQPAPVPVPIPVTPPPPQITLPPITTQAPLSLPGANVAATLSTPSLGSGIGGGGGTGRGTGSGEGTGSGVGPGSGGGTGGGVYHPGSGVTNPEVISEKKPAYTAEAMRAKIQGAVEIEAIVRADGTLDSARVVRSLDKMYGLDQKALEAVRQWKFRPGRLKATNQPVDIMVTIELTFTLR